VSKVRIGIIGAGGRGIACFGKLFAERFGERVRLVAIADSNKERAEAGAELLGAGVCIYDDFREMLARKDIEAVVITTPDYLHERMCLAAFKAGKDVLVDKPLATSAMGCLRVIEASRKAGKLLYMGFNLRHDVVVRKLKSLVDAGRFGEIFSIRSTEHYRGGRTYMSRWNRLKRYSGGLFIHKGCHDFDVINWLMGQVRPVKVSCFGGVSAFNERHLPFKVRKGVRPGPTCTACRYREQCPDRYSVEDSSKLLERGERVGWRRMWGERSSSIDGYYKDLCMYLSDKDTHDQGIAIIEYENGATVSHAEYFATPISNRTYMIEGTLAHGDADLERTRIEVVPRWGGRSLTYRLRRKEGGHGGTDPKMVAEFLDCIEKGRPPTASGIDGAWSVAIGQACELSRAEGRVVRISEVLDTTSSLLKEEKRSS